MKNMSEWKKRLDESQKDEIYCTGWGIIDGIIQGIKTIKKRYNNRKLSKINTKHLKD